MKATATGYIRVSCLPMAYIARYFSSAFENSSRTIASSCSPYTNTIGAW
jgi:hypothetical protein